MHHGGLQLICNAAGVLFIEAEVQSSLDGLNNYAIPQEEYKHLIPSVDYTIPFQELPLLIVQVTKFQCGGFSLSVNLSHVVVDGQSALHFMSEWARIARGEDILLPPCLDRTVLRIEEKNFSCQFEHKEFEEPPLLIGEKNNIEQKKKKTTFSMLKLTKSQIQKLQKSANENPVDINRPYTRYETVTGHIWRVACKARNHKPDQPTAVDICVDARRRIQPPLPQGYFGNATLEVIADSVAGEVMEKPLGYAAGLIREAIVKVSDEYVRSGIEYMKSQEDLSKFQDLRGLGGEDEPFYGNPNLGVVSWLSLPIYGVDFGWGREVFMGPGVHGFDGDVLILPSHDGGGDGSLVVALCLQVEHMEAFEKYFYEDI